MADLTGLALSTLRTYTTSGRSDLVRGEDFYVRRRGVRRRCFFTARGVQRLISGEYRAYHREDAPSRIKALKAYDPSVYGLPPRYTGTSRQEKKQRLEQTIFLAFRSYPSQPCAVPNCPCMIHRLGVPQAAEVYEVFPPDGRKK